MPDARQRRVDLLHLSRSRRPRQVSKDLCAKFNARYKLVLLAVVAFAGVSLLGVLATNSAANTSPSPGNLRAAYHARASRRRVRSHRSATDNAEARRARRRRHELNQPWARRERFASRTAYHDLGTPAASHLLSADYGQVLSGISANPAAMIAGQGRIVHYVNDYTAQVHTPTGFEVESSTAPLRVRSGSGKKLPVDLNLRRGGGLIEAERPLRPLAIGDHASAGVTLTANGISLSMLGADPRATLIEGKEAFYGEVADDVDEVATPKLDGVDLSAMLRSVESPEELRYRVGLPLGARLELEGGGAVITRGGSLLARIPAPSARDAQGTIVPTRMSVHGDDLSVAVAIRGHSYAYPIFVDPELLEEISENLEVWKYSAEAHYKWPPSYVDYEAGSFAHSGPGGGAPLSLTNETGALPYEAPPEITPYEEAGLPVYEFASRQKWAPDPENFIDNVYLDGISSSGASGSDIYSHFEIEACNEAASWNAPEAAPTAFVFTGLHEPYEWWDCSNWSVPGSGLIPADVRVEVDTGTTLEWEREAEPPHRLIPGEQVTVGPATISVAAIVVGAPLTWEEERELELVDSEFYGDHNPAQLSNTDCTAGDPVNCATGDLTETQEDLSVGGIGPGLHASRTYNSQLALTQREPGHFGYGWTGAYEDHIELEERCILNCWIGTDSVTALDEGGETEEEGGGEEAGSGPVLAYSFDEDEGKLAHDSFGTAFGTINGAQWTPGKFGPALRFSGKESSRVFVAPSPELNLSGPFTVEGWVRPAESTEGAAVAVKQVENQFAFGLEAGGHESGIPDGWVLSGGQRVEATEALPLHTWSDLALTFDGEDLRLYVDGSLVASEAAAPPRAGEGALRIGEGFKGKIDELRIYDRALDAKEIQTDESTPIGTTEGSEGPEEPEEEEAGEEVEEGEPEVFEQIAIVHQDNGSTAEFRRVEGETPWRPVGPLNRAALADEGKGLAYTLPDQSVLHFGSSGLLSSEEDRNGNAVTVHRDGEERISSVSDDSGRELVYSYDPEGFVESIEDPMGHVVHFEYENGNLVSVSQPGSAESRWEFGYDHDHELTSMTDGRGGVTKTRYRSLRAVRQEDPMGRVTSWSYSHDKEGATTTITEPNGSETVEQFDEDGLIHSLTRAAGSPIAATTTYEYNPADELIAVTNPEEETTEFTYDVNGNKVGEKNPEGDETRWKYNGVHEVTSETTPSGEKTTIVRDAAGNPETISRPAPEEETQTSTFEYGPRGELESMTDPTGATWTYGYDAKGDLDSETDPEGDERTWAYDEDSRETSTVSPRGNAPGAEPAEFTTSIERDPRGLPLKITDPLGGSSDYAYDDDGNLESMTDPNGHETRFTYDPDGERIKVERATGATEETGYDQMGQVISQTNGDEATTTYVRNALGEPIETIDPFERTTTHAFDAAGNLETSSDPEGATTSYFYDQAGRLEEIGYSDGTTPDVTLGYDEDGYLTSVVDGTGESTYEYDRLGRLIHSRDGVDETVGWKYNLDEEPIGLTYPNGKSVSRAYDESGRLESVTDWLGHTTSFAYNRNSDPTATTFPAGTGNTDEFSYDRADRMSGVTMKKGTETLASLAYSRDPAGQIESLVSEGLPGSAEEEFGYDNDARLTHAGEAEYGYDPANNLTEAPGTTNAYDQASQLESTTGASFTYDEEGKRTAETPASGPATTYKYDQAGDLTTIERAEEGETPAIAESFGYEGLGSLSSRTVGLTTAHFVWDVSESPELLLSDGEDSYIYGPGGLPFEQISSEEVPEYFHHDQLGSTRLMTNPSGEAAATFTYGAYGAESGKTGSETTALGYAGQYTLGQSGLQYMRARFYDPATAQFLTRDPDVRISRAPYSYARGNPLRFYDPTGLTTVGLCLSGTIGGLNLFGTGSICAQVSLSGDVGVTATYGAGAGTGSGDVQAGPGVEATNAEHISELSGPFLSGGLRAADGIGGSVEGFHSITGCNSVEGAFAGPAVGTGAAGYIAGTETEQISVNIPALVRAVGKPLAEIGEVGL